MLGLAPFDSRAYDWASGGKLMIRVGITCIVLAAATACDRAPSAPPPADAIVSNSSGIVLDLPPDTSPKPADEIAAPGTKSLAKTEETPKEVEQEATDRREEAAASKEVADEVRETPTAPEAEKKESKAAEATGGKPPLPAGTIASTIRRIGYPCESVVSTASLEGGEEPSYKITCSGGAVYRGTRKGGGMRFRKW